MLVSSIYEEAKQVLGKCDQETVFRRLTDAVQLANNQGKFDWNIGHMDICVCDGCVTLPADVATILASNVNGLPTLMRDQWFQYHANGPGTQKYVPWAYTDEVGRFSTYKDPDRPCLLIAEVESAADSNKELRVYGWDAAGKRIYTPGPDGVLEDGFLVPTVYSFSQPNPLAPAIGRIDRIQKAVTNGFIRLLAIDPTNGTPLTQIGYYLPWETEPNYRRIRVGNETLVRIKYRRKDVEVRGLQDWINIDNRQALLMLLKSVKFRLDNNFDQGIAAESEGMRLLSNEAAALRPPGLDVPQVIFNTYPAYNDDRMFSY